LISKERQSIIERGYLWEDELWEDAKGDEVPLGLGPWDIFITE